MCVLNEMQLVVNSLIVFGVMDGEAITNPRHTYRM